ncbi:putative rossmann-like alpha/beta/alpha sandwich protein [Lupinus albus]|uniref:Putative rossmann-like alpha/beta/alpha sandwich protein n=1 Tax=Lupinus albus TaxID=3870 RepID=A0A6A4NII4_LUPAL|nr:putative rossmann-like alpha/beta/alpha sandwich protein [Lupinus albus]
MWLQKNSGWDKKDGVNGIVAVAIDKDKGSQNALKWAIDHLLTRNNTVVLIHVNAKHASITTPSEYYISYIMIIYSYCYMKLVLQTSFGFSIAVSIYNYLCGLMCMFGFREVS